MVFSGYLYTLFNLTQHTQKLHRVLKEGGDTKVALAFYLFHLTMPLGGAEHLYSAWVAHLTAQSSLVFPSGNT